MQLKAAVITNAQSVAAAIGCHFDVQHCSSSTYISVLYAVFSLALSDTVAAVCASVHMMVALSCAVLAMLYLCAAV
jgi:hypothetical protein